MKKVLLTAAILVSTLLSAQSELEQLLTMPPIHSDGEVSLILEEYEDTIDSTQKALMFFIMVNSFDSVYVFEHQRKVNDHVVTETVRMMPLQINNTEFMLYTARAEGYFDEYLITREFINE